MMILLITVMSVIGITPNTVGKKVIEKNAVSGKLLIVVRKFGALGLTAMVTVSAIGILKIDIVVNTNK